MRRILISLLLLCTALLTGCATDQRSQSLTSTLNAYGSVVRWGDFENALQFVDPEVRKEHPPSALDLARFKQLRVTGYDDGPGPATSGENEVRQVVQISFANINTQAERTVVDHQLWHYDPVKKHWWLMSGLPNISSE
ncbi:hypothetical protein [Dyella silvatica]|uniref:hypothetical protein n=1 Tax=Dyella silvatica TaxID=2992128 RepID=UPI0022541B04|nr:hypothetical protein [Dyella silvatica]